MAHVVGRLCLLATALALAACGNEPTEPAAHARPVVLYTLAPETVEERVAASGELLAKQRADVAAQVPGEITAIHADEGEAVKAGTVVIEIDPERRKLDLDRAAARVSEARSALREFERQRARVTELAARDFASRTQLEQAQAALEGGRSRLQAAVADLGAAERATRDAQVETRFDGLIARRFVSRGEYVQPGQKLFELVSLDPIEVEFSLPESDAARVALGLPLTLTVAPFPGETFTAEISMVSPVVDARTRTLRVKALLANPDGRLRPGLFARADLGIAKRDGVLRVPEEAVLQRADGAVVFLAVEEGSRAQRRPIEIGRIHQGTVEVASGLQAGDTVVVRGHAQLVDGAVIAAQGAPKSPEVAAP